MIHLPGDPSLAEIWLLFIIFVVIPTISVISLVQIFFKKKSYLLFKIGSVILIALPALYTIAARNFGEWAELKESLQGYELQVNKFVSENGPITNYEKKQKLYEQYPRPSYIFKDSNIKIYVSYFEWISSENKIGISWGNGANAAFDLKTMWCVYSD